MYAFPSHPQIQSALSASRNEIDLIFDYDNPQVASAITPQVSANREVVFRSDRTDDTEVYYWSLPTRFVGNQLTAYGGSLNYTIRFTPVPSASRSRNNAPDVVLKSENDITILHYRREDTSPQGSTSYSVPMVESYWQRVDGKEVNREHMLMTLAKVSYILIKATYTTMTEEAALSHVSLDIALPRPTGAYHVRAVEVEQCTCPVGYQGLSCENCAPGYKRSNSGIYLNLCEPCDCNGHSDECDSDTGVCIVSGHRSIESSCSFRHPYIFDNHHHDSHSRTAVTTPQATIARNVSAEAAPPVARHPIAIARTPMLFATSATTAATCPAPVIGATASKTLRAAGARCAAKAPSICRLTTR